MVLWGRRDPYLLVPTAPELARLAVDPVARILDGGHWLHEEQPERVNALLRDFLKERACAASA